MREAQKNEIRVSRADKFLVWVCWTSIRQKVVEIAEIYIFFSLYFCLSYPGNELICCYFVFVFISIEFLEFLSKKAE